MTRSKTEFSLRLLGLLLPLGLAGLPGCGQPKDSSFSVSWKLVDAADPQPKTAAPLMCTDAGVATIRFQFGQDSNPAAQLYQVDFNCPQGSGITVPLREDNYDILALAVAPSGQPLSGLHFNQGNIDGPADLGLIIFQIQR